jgi:hypothetical protein
MSDFRDSDSLYRERNDPLRENGRYEPADGRTNSSLGWVVGAVFLVILLALAFGVGHEPNSQVASNSPTPPATVHPLGPPTLNPAPPANPGLTPPPVPTTPTVPNQ